MKIAFISLNRENLPDPVIPLGILSVMANTPSQHETCLIDLCFEDEPLAALKTKINDFAPDLVAMGMRNIQDATYSGTASNLNYTKEAVHCVRSINQSPIILGGSGFSVLPKEILAHTGADYGLAGEGEVSFPRFITIIETGDLSQLRKIPRFYSRIELPAACEALPTPKMTFLQMDSIQLPQRELADSHYLELHGTGNVQTKRGCALHCDYCTYPTIEGRSLRSRQSTRAADDMQAAAALPGTRHLFIVDSVFNIPAKIANDFCQELIAREFNTPWTCYLNPIGFTPKTASLMKQAGCTGYEIGSDSGSNKILGILKKGFTTEKIRKTSLISRDAGLKDCHTFILGTPGESMDDVEQTLEFVHDLNPFAAILMIWIDDEEALDPNLVLPRRKFREEILKRLEFYSITHLRWVIPQLQVNFEISHFNRLRRWGLKGPLWYYLELVEEQHQRKINTSAESADF